MEESLEGKRSEEYFFPIVGILAQIIQMSGVVMPACATGQSCARALGTVQLLWCVHLLHVTLKSLTWQMLTIPCLSHSDCTKAVAGCKIH